MKVLGINKMFPKQGAIETMSIAVRKLFLGGLASILFFVMCGVPAIAEAPSVLEEPVMTEAQEAPAPSVSVDVSEPQEQSGEHLLNEETEPEPAGEIEIIEDELVPLAGGPAPSVVIRANRDIKTLRVGDELVLTAELNGFQGLEYAIRWQACEDGQWRDIKGQDSTRMIIRITEDNASWAYRVAVDAAPTL